MGAEDIRRHVDKRLEYIRKELADIAEGIPEGPLQERLSSITGEVEKLVYETLAEVPKTADEQKKESGFNGSEHRGNQTSYGGVPELFTETIDKKMHKHTVSFGGIRQLFDVEMEVFSDEEQDLGDNENVTSGPSPSPTYELVGRLFTDGPLKGKKNYNGVTALFQKNRETVVNEYGEGRINLGKEFDTTGRNHDRNVSIGGVRQLTGADLDEDFFEDKKLGSDTEDNKMKEALTEPAARHHNHTASIGGVKQLVSVECDSFSEDDKQKSSPHVPNQHQEKELGGHERVVSVGGVRQLGTDRVLEMEDLDYLDTNEVEDQDQIEVAEAKDITKDPNPEDDLGQHERQVSHGGVRLLQDFDLGLDDLDDRLEDGKPRQLFDGQGTVEDPSGHERRRSNLQDGRELFEEIDKGGPLDQRRDLGNLNPENVKIQDLKREHLQLKMSKIELIKSTAEEIDRLREIVKILANQLRQLTKDHTKLLNATIGGQVLDSVFGAFTGFFSAPSEPLP